MLNRLETKVMDYLFTRCRGKRTILIAPDDILRNIMPKYEITKKQLEVHMKNLVLDGYLDYSSTNDKDGNVKYVVTLTTRGEAFQRERDDVVRRRWRSIGWKVLLTLIGVVITSIFWWLI